MKKIFIHSTIICFVIMIALVCELFLLQSFSSLLLSNHLAMVSLLFLIIGLTLTIIASGSFDFFIYSLKRLRQKEKQSFQPKYSQQKKFRYTAPLFLICASELFLCSILIFVLQ